MNIDLIPLSEAWRIALLEKVVAYGKARAAAADNPEAGETAYLDICKFLQGAGRYGERWNAETAFAHDEIIRGDCDEAQKDGCQRHHEEQVCAQLKVY